MAAKREKREVEQRERCKHIECPEAELQLLEAVARFHGGQVKAMQALTKQLQEAKEDHGQIPRSPGGREIGKHIAAMVGLSTKMNQQLAALMTRLCAEYQLPATARRAMSRAISAAKLEPVVRQRQRTGPLSKPH